ncbi:MAG: acyl--CoA ligase [Clostridiales bacterium]|jgi:long-chain acyl-CoA synthetase|nr:acyl--CoA ligase [Clostridiales bacterium]
MKKDTSLYGAFAAGTEKTEPSLPCILYMNKAIPYGKVKARIRRTAAALTAFGIKAGDVVMSALPNIPQAMYVLYAASAVGAVIYPVHPVTGAEALGAMIQKTRAKILFAPDVFCAAYAEACERAGAAIISCRPTFDAGAAVKIGYRLTAKIPGCSAIKFTEFLKRGRGRAAAYAETDPRATAVLLNSGGTGGEPKTVELSAYALNALCDNGLSILGADNVGNKYMLSVLPFFHGFGLCMGLHAMACHGGCNVFVPRFKRKPVIDYIKKGKINFMIGVPALYNALLSHPEFKGEKLKNIEAAFIGGDFVPQTVIEAFDERMLESGSRARLFEGYGLTETVTVACVNTHARNKPNTVGAPLNGVEISAIDGELVVRGETLMNGYYGDPDATAAAFVTDAEGKRWLRSGDCGFVDGDGFVRFKQRIKRIIKVSGATVFPSEIEQLASRESGVTNVCAFGVPDGRRGDKVVLAVESSVPDTAGLISRLRERLDANLSVDSRPREIFVTARLPLTKVGKADVDALKKICSENKLTETR